VNVAALPTLRIGQVGIVLRQLLLAVVPLVEAGWIGTMLRFWETVEKKEWVVWVVVKIIEEGEGGEEEDAEECGAQTAGTDRKGSKSGGDLFFYGDWAREDQGYGPQHRGRR